MIGLKGIRMEAPGHVASCWDEAFAADRPVVVDALTDPNVPPLPPHTTWSEAKAMISALWKGDPDSGAIIRQSFKGKMQGYTAN